MDEQEKKKITNYVGAPRFSCDIVYQMTKKKYDIHFIRSITKCDEIRAWIDTKSVFFWTFFLSRSFSALCNKLRGCDSFACINTCCWCIGVCMWNRDIECDVTRKCYEMNKKKLYLKQTHICQRIWHGCFFVRSLRRASSVVPSFLVRVNQRQQCKSDVN